MARFEGPVYDGSHTPARRFRHEAQRIRWNTGDDTSKLDADVTVSKAASGPSAWTRTITAYGTSPDQINRLRFTTPTTNTTERRWQPITGATSIDSEIRSTWYGHWGSPGGNAGGQFGHVHRFQLHPSTGRPWGYIVWHDITLNVDTWINMDTWYVDSGYPTAPYAMTQGRLAGTPSGASFVDLAGLQRWVEITASSKVGTTVTVTLNYGHGVVVGDVCQIFTDAALSAGEQLNATAVTATSATFTSGTAATNPIYFGGPGSMQLFTHVMPYTVVSQLVDTTLRVKAWPVAISEPSWNDERYAAKWTDATSNVNGPPAGTVGQACIYNGHLGDTVNSFNEWGELTWRSLD